MWLFVAERSHCCLPPPPRVILAEGLHSLADICNQLLLRAGVQQSRRKPTVQHPYGFHREKYIYSLISAVGIFCVGAGASIVHGVSSIMDPPQLEHMGTGIAGGLGASSGCWAFTFSMCL